MKVPYEFWIGLRYSGLAQSFLSFYKKKNKSQDHFISFISIASMLGIALGVSALIVVLSVMNGFQKEIQERMLSILSHIEIYIPRSYPEPKMISKWKDISQIAEKNPSVLASAPFLYSQALIINKENIRGIQVKGIIPEFEQEVSQIRGKIFKGNLDNLSSGGFGIIIGHELAESLHVDLGDQLTLATSQSSSNSENFYPRIHQLKIVGIFCSGHYEYDSALGFINIQDALNIFSNNGILGIRLALEDIQVSRKIALELEKKLPTYVVVKDWSQSNQAWFSAIKTEKRMMFLLLFLIVTVATFSLFSSLVMTVKDKKPDIAVLRTIGSGSINIGYIFLIQGTLIGSLGTILGILLGITFVLNINPIIAFIEIFFQTELIPNEIYFFSKLPSDLQISDIVTVSLASISLSLLATIYPSWRASKLHPIQLLRYD